MRQPIAIGHTRPARKREASRRHRYIPRIARAGVLAALEIGVAVALLSLLRTTSVPVAEAPQPLTAQTVAAKPASFRSQNVRVVGTVLEWPTKIKRSDAGTFVLAGTKNARLLVVPADDARLTAFRVGTNVIVGGSVVIPPDSGRLARRATSRTAIAKRANAPALIKATKVELAR
jgi:hypothetical protein